MKLGYFLTLSASLLMFACTEAASNSEPAASPTVSAAPTEAQSEPQPIAAANQTAIKSGTFVSGEHATEGTASIVMENGQPVLKLDQGFKTSEMGPDLVVVLHHSDDVLGSTKPPAYPLQEGDYIVLAPLKSFSGAQSYPIPRNINLEDYKSAVIWCRKFNATFGVAPFRETSSTVTQ